MTDKFSVGVDLDTKEAEKKLADLEKKIKNMREMGSGGSTSQLVEQYRSQNQKDKADRLEDFRNRANTQQRQMVIKDLKTQELELDKQIKKYDSIGKLQDNLVKNGNAYNKSLEMRAVILEKINKITGQIATGSNVLNPSGPGGAHQVLGLVILLAAAVDLVVDLAVLEMLLQC